MCGLVRSLQQDAQDSESVSACAVLFSSVLLTHCESHRPRPERTRAVCDTDLGLGEELVTGLSEGRLPVSAAGTVNQYIRSLCH